MQPNCSAAATHVRSQASIPACPVAQFAFPAFTSTAPTRPPVPTRCRRPTVTGAATTWLLVNIAAACPLLVTTAAARSGLPLILIPAATAPHANPCGRAAPVVIPSAPTSFAILLIYYLP